MNVREGECPGGSGVKNLLAKQETRAQSLGREDPLAKGKATHSTVLAREIPWTGAWWATVQNVARIGHDLATKPPPPYGRRHFKVYWSNVAVKY